MVTVPGGGGGGEPVSLLDLNDDVLEVLLRKINIFQQYGMAKIHSRFRNIAQTLWRTRARHVVLHEQLFQYDNKSEVSSEQFVDFIRSLMPYMHRLMCHQLDVGRLRLLSEQPFELVNTFEWIGSVQAEETKENRIAPLFMDDDLLMLRRILPNLRSLKLRSCQVTGKYLSRFSTLRKLSLDDCQYLESEYFRQIFRKLRLTKFDIMEDCDEVNCCDLVALKRCPTLQHIKIADYHLCFEGTNSNDILRIPALHKLSIYSKNFVFDVLERMSRNNVRVIEGFKFSGVLQNLQRFFNEVGHMRQLRKFSIFASRHDQELRELIQDEMLKEMAAKLCALNELHLCSCDFESHRGLLHFVAQCRQLRLINVSNSRYIGDQFIWRCAELIRRQSWRTDPLELCIRNTDIAEDIVEQPRYVRHAKLKINTTHVTCEPSPPGVLKFTFER